MFWVVIGLALLGLDTISKYVVNQFLTPIDHLPFLYPYGGVGVFKDFCGIEFSLVHARNSGMAWSLFQGHPALLLILRVALVVGLSCYFYRLRKEKQLLLPFGLILCGAIGNIIDYFLYGHVIDMLHFVFWGYYYPVFNIADSCITIGVTLLFLLSWRRNARLSDA